MTTDVILAVCAIVTVAGGFIAYIISSVSGIATRISALEVKVDTMWSFQMRRAKSEAIQNNIAEMNSPLKVKQEYLRCLEPIKPDLEKLYQTQKWADDYALALAIEKEFGNKLLTLICIPHGLDQGACLLAATAVAKNDLSVFDDKN